MSAPPADPWAEAERWAADLQWATIDSAPAPLAVATFESGSGFEGSLIITPGRVAIVGQVPGMSPEQARRLTGLLCRGIAMAEHPPAPVKNPVDSQEAGS